MSLIKRLIVSENPVKFNNYKHVELQGCKQIKDEQTQN